MREYAETLLTHHCPRWSFAFDNRRSTVGLANYDTRTISISRHWTTVLAMSKLYATVEHEVAHAIAGNADGDHGPQWRRAALSLGNYPRVCTPVTVKQEFKIAPWIGYCPHDSNHQIALFAAPRSVQSCAECAPHGFDSNFMFQWAKHGVMCEPPATYQAHKHHTLSQ